MQSDLVPRKFFIGRAIVGMLVVLVVVVLIGAVLINRYYKYVIGQPVSSSAETLAFTVESGESLSSVVDRLDKAQLLKNKLIFKFYLRSANLDAQIQAGDYEIPRNISMVQLAQFLQKGTFDVSLTVIEGLRKEEVLETILDWYDENGIMIDSDKVLATFMTLTQNDEGRLFPDTYILPRDSSVEDIAALMLNNFEVQFRPVYESSGSKMLISDVLILASLVEREARTDDSRKIVAGILQNRLSQNWPLEVDATVQYSLGYQDEENSWWKKELTEEDLKIDSPYNTRLYPGIPPAPICNSSLSSIEAVLNPVATDYWFYLTGEDGEMHYAKTLDEHQANISKYL